MKTDNAYYFSSIQKIGGIETFLYMLAMANPDRNITIYYQTCDLDQMKRLNRCCNLVQYRKGVKIRAAKAFFNFNLDPLINGDVEADRRILIVHGNYRWLKGSPPMHPDIDEVYAVSRDSAEAYTDLTGISCGVVYNPLVVEEKRTLMLMSATRIDTSTENVKGGSRMLALADALDRYCLEHGCSYQWHVYTTKKRKQISHRNIQMLDPTLDIVQYMPRYDYVIQLSDNFEGFNYTVNEALTQGVPVVATRCDVYAECGITDKMAIWLDFDCGNADQAAEEMFTREFSFSYRSPESRWGDLLVKGRKQSVEKVALYSVTATSEAKRRGLTIAEADGIPEEGDMFVVPEGRLDELLGSNRFHAAFVRDAKRIPERKEKGSKR